MTGDLDVEMATDREVDEGLFAREKGGFYHDGRFPDLNQVIAHYARALRLSLSDTKKADLIQFLKSL